MESVLDQHDKVKQCYSKYNLDEIRSMPAKQLRNLCLTEREELANSFNKLDMKTIIDERISIIKQQREDRYTLRMAELKNFYKL
jgi:hypothetical protein